MTRLNRSITGFLGMGVLAFAVASAEAHQPYRDKATAYRGSGNTAITRGERKRLAKHRRHVERVRDRALRDDRITRKEARKIRKAEAKLSRHRVRAMDDDAGRRWDRGDWRDWWTRGTRDDRWDNRRDDRHNRSGRYGDRGRRGWHGKGGQRAGHYHHHHHRDRDRDETGSWYSRRDRVR